MSRSEIALFNDVMCLSTQSRSDSFFALGQNYEEPSDKSSGALQNL